MLGKKLKTVNVESKLSKTLAELSTGELQEKTGFIKNVKQSSLFKTKSFRLRESDSMNLSNIVGHMNNNNERAYSESQVIRGMINYISDNLDSNIKKIMPYIKGSR